MTKNSAVSARMAREVTGPCRFSSGSCVDQSYCIDSQLTNATFLPALGQAPSPHLMNLRASISRDKPRLHAALFVFRSSFIGASRWKSDAAYSDFRDGLEFLATLPLPYFAVRPYSAAWGIGSVIEAVRRRMRFGVGWSRSWSALAYSP